MSFTPFNAPFLSPLLGDHEIAGLFSVKQDLSCMLQFEAELATVQAKLGMIPSTAAETISKVCSTFELNMPQIQAAVARDGMVVPELISQLRAACMEDGDYLHFGTTSQDVIDTSLILRLKDVNTLLRKRLESVVARIEELDQSFGHKTTFAYTRMQPALPVKVSARLAQWGRPLNEQLSTLAKIETDLHVVQLGGPVGDLQKMEKSGDEVRKLLAERLGLNDPGHSWHTDRGRLVAYCNWLAQTCNCLGKIGQDFAVMSMLGKDQLTFEGAGSSSAMGHKQNPVKAEVLVSQARFASTLAGGLQNHSIHELERSGASWTFEWLVLPQLAVVAGSALDNAVKLLNSITSLGEA